MRRIVALLLVVVLLLSGCAEKAPKNETSTGSPSPAVAEDQPSVTEGGTASPTPVESIEMTSLNDEMVSFSRMDDPDYLAFLQGVLCAGLEEQFCSDDYSIDSIKVVYLSKEYLEELEYNSRANIWFGYTLEEIKEAFGDVPYVFTLGEDNTTIVVPFESYDDTYERVIKNVAVGAGVILICATVSVVTGGVGAATISTIFAASAKTGVSMGLSWAAFSGLIAGTIEGVKTKDVESAVKAAALAGSEGFKWGAIAGAVIGGVGEVIKLRTPPETVKAEELASETPRGAELRALNKYGGEEQITFLNGEEVAFGTAGATRPDVVRQVGNHIEAIEVKFYNLENQGCLNTLKSELTRQVSDRITNLPAGSTQRIVLDVTGKGYTKSFVMSIVDKISEWLNPIYPNIPIDIAGL